VSAVACDLDDLDDVSRMLDELSSAGAIDFRLSGCERRCAVQL
jgi:hypothetical protein